MRICITIGGRQHCFYLPILEWPITIKVVGPPPPPNYPYMIHDAMVLASIENVSSKIDDQHVRAAVQQGVKSAVAALQKHAGEGVQVQLGH